MVALSNKTHKEEDDDGNGVKKNNVDANKSRNKLEMEK